MIANTQMLKGSIEGLVLKIIAKEEIYGYLILENLKELGFTELSEGTLYPILMRLENRKAIKSEKKASPLGPARKYYTVLEKGYEEIDEFKNQWDTLNNIIQDVWK